MGNKIIARPLPTQGTTHTEKSRKNIRVKGGSRIP